MLTGFGITCALARRLAIPFHRWYPIHHEITLASKTDVKSQSRQEFPRLLPRNVPTAGINFGERTNIFAALGGASLSLPNISRPCGLRGIFAHTNAAR